MCVPRTMICDKDRVCKYTPCLICIYFYCTNIFFHMLNSLAEKCVFVCICIYLTNDCSVYKLVYMPTVIVSHSFLTITISKLTHNHSAEESLQFVFQECNCKEYKNGLILLLCSPFLNTIVLRSDPIQGPGSGFWPGHCVGQVKFF